VPGGLVVREIFAITVFGVFRAVDVEKYLGMTLTLFRRRADTDLSFGDEP
jgi:hypothetical protein